MTALIKDPVLSLSYGPSGIGKTTDTGLSFPNALFIAAPGALQSIRNVAGYDPLVENATTLLDVTKLVSKVGEYRAKGADVKIDAVAESLCSRTTTFAGLSIPEHVYFRRKDKKPCKKCNDKNL
jgi:hypothetical protein